MVWVTQILKEEKYSKYKDIQIVMLSGRDDIQSKILSLEMGVEDYIQKPFNFTRFCTLEMLCDKGIDR